MVKAAMSKAAQEQAKYAKRKGWDGAWGFSAPPIAKKHLRQKYDLDPDTLECPICSEALSPPVYQCENGHAACAVCCLKVTKGCPSCAQPIGRIRNIAIEKVIESLQIECKHAAHGCNAMVKYTERAEHEKSLCEFRQLQCPVMRLFPDCSYAGPKASMPSHLNEKHRMRVVETSGSSASFRMKSSDGDVMVKAKEVWFMVCWVENFQGNAFHCDSVGASKEVAYKLTVKPVKLDSQPNKVYSMEGVALGERGEAKTWDEDFLLVPGESEEHAITVSLI